MTVDRLLIEDFQTHERLEVELDSEITTIVGPSDTGKSSIVRALRWLAVNRPRGDGFMRWGCKAGRMCVRAKADGKTVRRERGGSENFYAVGKDEYRAFGNDVPPAVWDVLKLTEVNFAGQHDPPYWLSLSPPELARKLNEVVDLDEIDRVAASIASRTRSLESEGKVIGARLGAARDEARGLGWAVLADKELQGLEAKEKELEDGKDRKLALTWLVASIVDKKAAAERKVPDLSGMDSLRDRIGVASMKFERLDDLIEQIKSTERTVEVLKRKAVDAAKRLKKETGDECPLCGAPIR